MNDQEIVATLAVQVVGPVSREVGATDSSEDVANTLAYLKSRLADERACTVIIQSHKTMVLGFEETDDAFRAACVIQQAVSAVPTGRRHLHLRSLLGVEEPTGEAASEATFAMLDGMHSLPAKGLFANRRFVEALSPPLRTLFRVADIDRSETLCGILRGELYESLYSEQECTAVMMSAIRTAETEHDNVLSLRWREHHLRLHPQHPPITLGRDGSASVQIQTDYASRQHALVAFEQTNFVLHDESTNGTYVCIDDDEEKFLHIEQIVLRGQGVISLGRSTRNSSTHLIYFKTLKARDLGHAISAR